MRGTLATHRKVFVIGQCISHYRILRRLGAGGMGEVFEAEDTDLQRRVAVKILPEKMASTPLSLERFKREARALAALNHPNIVTVYSVEEATGIHFLTMELVEGRPLSELIPQGGFAADKLFSLGIPLADALAAAHARGIGHRDLKPSNIMVTEKGRIKVIDFGLAKLFAADTEPMDVDASTLHHTIQGQIVGTPSYMSPEQIEGGKVDHRTDIFSLGVLLYEMASDERPFKGENSTAVMSSILRDAPKALAEVKPELPEHLGRVVRRCLQKDPDERYQTDLDVRNELKGLQEETRSGQLAVTLPKSKQNRSARESGPSPRRALAMGAMAIVFFACAGMAYYWLKAPLQRTGISQPSIQRRIESVAVLPFKSLVTETNRAHFADMVTEEIIGKLGEMSGSRNSALKKVISAQTMMTYRGTTLSTRALAQELNVDCLVTGSLTVDGTRASVRVQLITAAEDKSIWSTNYVAEVNELMQLENDVALGISRAIHLELTPSEQSRLSNARQVDSRALEAFARGKYALGSNEDNLRSINHFEEAVRIAPDFAAGHAALAAQYVDRYFRYVPEEHKQWEEKAFSTLDKALQLDPDLAEAHATLGWALWTPFKKFQHEEAMVEAQHAAALNPNSFDAHMLMGTIYLHTGFAEEGLVHAQRAAQLNRLASFSHSLQAAAFLFKLEYERSLPLWRKGGNDNFPSVVGSCVAWAQFALGQTNAAAATLKQYSEDKTGELIAMKAILLDAAGDRAGAIKELENAKTRNNGYGEFHHTAYLLAAAYARMNMREEALSWLENAANDGFPCYSLFVKDPNLDNLRGTPGFDSFLKAQKKDWQERKDTWLKRDELVKASGLR